MKYFVAGQKKNSWFYSKKNRFIYGALASVASAFLVPFLFEHGVVFEWKTFFQFLVIFVVLELAHYKFVKEERGKGMVSLDLQSDAIVMTYFNEDTTVIPHNQIQAIHKDVTKIVIDVKNKKKVYGIPYSYFSYDDLQKMKIDVDAVSKKISIPSTENPALG
jgi:hypothetical protein